MTRTPYEQFLEQERRVRKFYQRFNLDPADHSDYLQLPLNQRDEIVAAWDHMLMGLVREADNS